MTTKEKIEKLATELGFEDLTNFAHYLLIEENMTFAEVEVWLREKHGIVSSYASIYLVIRKHAPKDFSKRTYFNKIRDNFAKNRGFSSFIALLRSFTKRNLNYREIAEELCLKSPINVKRMEKKYGMKIVGGEDCKKAGFVNQARFRVWLEKSKKLGFSSVEEALKQMKEEGKSVREIAELFDVTAQALCNRISRIK